MPAMPRPSKKANKIVFNLIGTPAIFAHKPTKRDKYLREKTRGIVTRYVKGAQYEY